MFKRLALAALLLLGACATPAPRSDDDDDRVGDDDDGRVGDDDDDSGQELADPFVQRADESEGLVNISASLEELLEYGQLRYACDQWRAQPDDRRLMLLCGKWMFFYEGFEGLGVPAPILDFVNQNFEAELGEGLARWGMVADPYDPEGRPLGFSPGAPMGSVETLAFTCANCHFGQLPDGRYAVGAPNFDYDYGALTLGLFLLPNAAAPGFDPSSYHPDAVADLQPLLDRLAADPLLGLTLGLELLPLLGSLPEGGMPTMSWEEQGHYARWEPGTQDFVMAPLPIDDGVVVVSRILDLWGVPRPEEAQALGMPHAMLAWSGGADSLATFLDGFVRISAADPGTWNEARLRPLIEYLYSLRAPENPAPPAPEQVARGQALFVQRGCLECHDGADGAGREVFTFEEVGTDDALRYWADPELSGEICCGLGEPGEGNLTHGVKAPRLLGMWSRERFLHNGSLTSLEQLLCLEPRPGGEEPVYGSQGHEYGCDLPVGEREALIAWLLAH